MATKRMFRGCLAAVLAAGAALSSAARAADAEVTARWLDVESRIQYAYYTEDRRTLESLAASVATDTTAGGAGTYYVALANYRLAELAAPGGRAGAKLPANRCVSSLERDTSAAEPAAAERLALQSACLRLLATLEPLRSPYLGLESGSAMRRALLLEPHNPRVLLLRALEDRDRGDDPMQVIGELRQSVAAFERERTGIERVPEWGAAEAYVFLGRGLLERGQALAARGALEHALLLVPEFALAHRLMARITAG